MEYKNIYDNIVKALVRTITTQNETAKAISEDKNMDTQTSFTRYWDAVAQMVILKGTLIDSGITVELTPGTSYRSISTNKLFTTIETAKIDGNVVLDSYCPLVP